MNRPNNVIAPVVSSKLFTWTKNMGVIEDSDLYGHFDLTTARYYNDSADNGFIVRSERTNHEVSFFFHHEIRDAEGELQALVYVSLGQNYEIHILND